MRKLLKFRCYDCGNEFTRLNTYMCRNPETFGHHVRVCDGCYKTHGWKEREQALDYNRFVYARSFNPEHLAQVPDVHLTDGRVIGAR